MEEHGSLREGEQSENDDDDEDNDDQGTLCEMESNLGEVMSSACREKSVMWRTFSI